MRIFSRSRLLWVLLCVAWPVMADQVTISARYTAGQPGFLNTTPQPVYLCRDWPSTCNGVTTVSLPLSYAKRAVNLASDERDRFYVRLPGRQTVQLTHERDGTRHDMTFQVRSFSQRVATTGGASPVYLGQSMPAAACGHYAANSSGSTVRYLWGLRRPGSPTVCHSSSNGPAGQVTENRVDQAAAVLTLAWPTPSNMRHGKYRGTVVLSVGEGGDLDFGSQVTELNTNTLVVNVELDVIQHFRLEFPAGSERAVLEPPGGWLRWKTTAAPPPRLYRDQPFRLWASGPFKVHATCQYAAGAGCGISNGSQTVPFATALSLPGGVAHNGAAVNRVPVPVGPAQAASFTSAASTINRPAQLHFEVDQATAALMMNSPGTTYRGDVTIVFDAEL